MDFFKFFFLVWRLTTCQQKAKSCPGAEAGNKEGKGPLAGGLENGGLSQLEEYSVATLRGPGQKGEGQVRGGLDCFKDGVEQVTEE